MFLVIIGHSVSTNTYFGKLIKICHKKILYCAAIYIINIVKRICVFIFEIKNLTLFTKNKKFPFYKQYDRTDCGPACLRMLAKYYGKTYSPEYLRNACHLTHEGVSVAGITEGAEAIGLKTLPINVTWESLEKQVPLPCIAHWRQRHFLIVYKVEKEKVYVADPDHGLITYTQYI